MEAEKREKEVVRPLNLLGFNVVNSAEEALAVENDLLAGSRDFAEGQHLTRDPERRLPPELDPEQSIDLKKLSYTLRACANREVVLNLLRGTYTPTPLCGHNLTSSQTDGWVEYTASYDPVTSAHTGHWFSRPGGSFFHGSPMHHLLFPSTLTFHSGGREPVLLPDTDSDSGGSEHSGEPGHAQ
jgi:hypothetical protein